MLSPTSTYPFYSDPGHGWLAVPTSELAELGIAGEITGYSYRSKDGRTSYLEEDCDYTTFAKAWEARTGEKWVHDQRTTEHNEPRSDSFVRSLPHYGKGGA